MATTRRRSSSSVLVQKDSIAQAGSLLQQLPEKPREAWSLREAIRQLQDDITLALNRGYTHEEVAKMLSEKGVKISPSSLKSYLAASRKDKESTPRKRAPRGSRMAAPAPVEEPVTVETPEAPAEPRKRAPRSTTPRTTKTAAKTKTSPSAKTTTRSTTRSTTAPRAPRGRKKQDD